MLRNTLELTFGYNDFKNRTQREATIAIYEGERDVFVRTPPGSGKSLCFQLPAVMKEDKVAIVFSPNLALIKNQIDFLREKRIRAHAITSMTSYDVRDEIKNDIQSDSPQIKLVYVTPEMGKQWHFRDTIECIRSKKLSYFIIDEAHCVSDYANDFRPSCGELGIFREMHPNIPIIALTATAIPEIQDHIFERLHMRDVLTFSQPVFRPNLFYDVWFWETLDKPIMHLKNFILDALGPLDDSIAKYNRNCGIIYCRTIGVTNYIADELTYAGIRTLPYHSDLDPEIRNQVQDLWMTQMSNVRVIAATIDSFGLGIDKKSVRFVVHCTVPKSIAAYCRESGRAGRDDNRAHCRIYFSNREAREIRSILPANNVPRFQEMISYCLQASCRHAAVAEYLQDPPPLCENTCDVCVNKIEVQERIAQYQQLNLAQI